MRIAVKMAAIPLCPTANAQEPAPESAASNRSNSSDDGEIVVTAQKREEKLRKVPASISVITGKQTDKSTLGGVAEILREVPGAVASISPQSGGTQLAIRGATAWAPTFGGSGAVAHYLDVAPFTLAKTAVVPDANIYDLARVEVLRRSMLNGGKTLVLR